MQKFGFGCKAMAIAIRLKTSPVSVSWPAHLIEKDQWDRSETVNEHLTARERFAQRPEAATDNIRLIERIPFGVSNGFTSHTFAYIALPVVLLGTPPRSLSRSRRRTLVLLNLPGAFLCRLLKPRLVNPLAACKPFRTRQLEQSRAFWSPCN